MNAQTDDTGRVTRIFVTIYDSLEFMYGDLCLDLDLHARTGMFKYKRDKEHVLVDFI